ncbi:hypothetical protein ACFLTP_00760 [Chloroflexota bacterium]
MGTGEGGILLGECSRIVIVVLRDISKREAKLEKVVLVPSGQ